MSERTAPSVTPSSSNDSPAPAPTDDLGQSARRGAVFIPLAKLSFLVSALLLQLLLPRALGSSALYGVWTLVSSWLSTFNNVMITATIQPRAYVSNYLDNTISVLDLDPRSPSYRRMVARIGLPSPKQVQ